MSDRVLRAAEEVGRSGARAATLATLAQWPVDTIEQLRASLGLTHSATVRVIDGLVADGLVTREHAGGGPAVRPQLTKAGYSEARRVVAIRNEALQPLVGVLSDAEVAALTGILERLLGAMTSDYDAGELICRLCELGACPQDVCPVDVRQQRFKQVAEAEGESTSVTVSAETPSARRASP